MYLIKCLVSVSAKEHCSVMVQRRAVIQLTLPLNMSFFISDSVSIKDTVAQLFKKALINAEGKVRPEVFEE